jgi:hypothetical protein
MKVYTDQTIVLEGFTDVVEHRDKDQALELKLAESFILCGHQAISIAVLLHSDESVKMARGKVTDKGSDVDMTRLESGRSFLPAKASMTMREKLSCVARFQNCFLAST